MTDGPGAWTMRRKAWAVVTTVVAAAGGVLVASGPAGAVDGSFAATCITTGGPNGPITSRRLIAYSAHAPDSVAPGASFAVPVSFGYAVPPNATIGGALLDATGTSPPSTIVSAAPGSSTIAGSPTFVANGGAGSVASVRLRSLESYAQIGDVLFADRCTADHTLTVARVGNGIPAVSIGDAAVVEGSSGTRALQLAVSLSRPSSTPVTVAFATEDGTATAGSDYVAQSGTVTVPAGFVSRSATVTVRVRGDRTIEPKENLRIRLHDPVGAVLGRAVGTGRIIDDDPETGVRLSVGDGSVVEGARGTPSARFTISLSAPVTQRVTFHFSTSDGTAVVGKDYGALSTDWFIEAGSTSATLPVEVLPNGVPDGNRTFRVHLSAATGAVIGRANGVGTIIDDD